MKHFTQIIVFLFLVLTTKIKSQETFLMDGNNTIKLSKGIFFDDGGANGNVSDKQTITTFIGKEGLLELYFTDFNLPYDALINIYDGASTSGALLGTFTSQDKPWNFKANSITIEYIPSSSKAPGRGWKGVLKTSGTNKNPTVQSAPESDCPQAIPLCANNTAIVSAAQYVDLGSINDDSGTCYGGTGSGGSVWYSFSPNATGPLDFLIIPAGSTDYDFVVWDITNGCSSKTQVLCNYSATQGNTGASSGGASASEGSSGNLLCTRPTVTLGRQYAICINFYGGSNDGYTLQFENEASSVGINDVIPPTINYVTGNGCTNTTVLDVYFSEWINCTTLQIGDFTMPGRTFTMINNYCNGGKTNHVQISVSPALTAVAGTPTSYTLSVLNTGAGTSMNDMCGNPMNVNYVITLGITPVANAGADKYNCKSPGVFGIGSNYTSVTLNGSGGAAGSIYNWSDGSTGQNPSVAPTQTTNYTLTVSQGVCTATDVVTVFVENQPVINLGPDVLMCSGLPLSLSASGGGTYQWQVQTGTVPFFGGPTFGNIAGATSSTYSTNPVQFGSTGSTYYQVNVISPNGACTGTDQIKITFGAGSFGILSSKSFLCLGESTTLSLPTGMNAYTWSTGTSANTPLVVSPNTTTSYTASSTTAGCAGTSIITVPVRPLPVVIATATPSAICIGNTATLSATPTGSNVTITENFEATNGFTFVNGANNKWYWGTAAFAAGTKGIYIGTASTNNNYDIGNAFTPKTATNHAYKDYSISSFCTSDLSFKWKSNGQAGQAELTVWLVPNTFVPIAGTAITAGAGIILLGGPYFGQTTYQNVTLNLTPYVGQTARIVFQWNNTGSSLIGGPVVANPAASIDDVVFNESMSYTYNWSSSPAGLGATTQSLTVTPPVATAYSVTVTRCDGCSNSATVPLSILSAAPVLTISPSSTICPGQSSTLTISGGTTYTWSPSATLSSANGSSVTASPTTTTIYTVSTTACGGAITNQTVQVAIIGAPPVIGAISGSTLICPNSTGITYSVTNAASANYTWTVPSGAIITSAPTNSNVIMVNFGATAGTVSVTAVSSCGTTTASVNVSLNPALNLTVTPGNTSICAGSTTSLSVSGATNYTWSPSTTLSSTNGASVTASPTATTIYTVIGSTGTCTNSATATITINPSLSLTVTPNNTSICAGGSTSLSASGATNYTWSPAATLSSSNGATVTASPTTATTYTVLGATGTCTGSATATVSISAGLTLTLTSNTPTVCPGGSALLDVNGATNYTWSPAGNLSSANGSNVTATPLANTIYTVMGSTGTCTSVATISIGIGACVSSACNLALIRSTLIGAGNIELLGMNNTCSLYFINPQFMTGPQAQTYAQTFGANLISVQSATENADLVQALSNQGYASNVVWIGYSDAVTEGSFVWYDGAPIAYSNWAPGEPNNSGDEDCTQIYPDGGWNDLNCSGYNSLSVIEVNICPQVTTVSNVAAHCANTNVTLTASTLLGSPGYTYTWVQSGTETFTNTSTPGNTDIISVTSMGVNTFTVFSEDRYSCPQSASITLSVNPTPTITVNSASICSGETTTLTANGAATYSWIPGTGLSATSGSVVTGNPTSTQNYTVVGMDGNGCFGGTITAIAVNPLPTITVSPNVTICPSASTTLTASGAASYTWSPALSLSSSNGNIVTATPSVSTTYTVQGTFGNCVGTATVSVYVSGNGFSPNVYIIQKNSLCDTTILNWLNITSVTPSLAQGNLPSGLTVSATHSGGGMSTTPSMFSGATFPASYNVPIAATTIRNDLAGTFNFCFNQPVINPQIAFASIGQAALPITITTSVPYQVVWTGIAMTYVNPTTLIGAEGFTIIRFPGVHTCVSLNYSGDENYCNLAFGVMDTECQGQPICPGDPIELIGNGASTYSWSNGANTTTIAPTPSVTTNYSVVGVNSDGCTNTASTTVLVNPSPTLTVNSSTICVGQQTATLTATGADTFTWSAGLSATTGSVVTGTPITTQSYTVTATDVNGCISDTTTTITVNQLPNIIVNSATICVGQQTATLIANGASTYTWTPGLSSATGSVVTGNPTSTQNYTIVAMDLNGCFGGTTTAITVNSLPTVTVNSSTICIGQQTATLNANGANSYTWSPGLSSVTGFSVTGNPTSTQNYTVIGTDVNGCINGTITAIAVNPLPVIILNSSTICIGQQTATLTANGASTYTWSPGLSSATGSVVTGNPTSTQNYTVAGTDANGCINGTITAITVNPLPIITVAPNMTVCPLSANTLTVSGAATYTWSPNIYLNTNTSSTVISTPSVTTTYTIDGLSSLSCTNSAVMTVVVTNTVVVNASASTPTICPLGSSSLTATGATTYTWSPALTLSSANGATVIATPPTSTTYTVIGSTSTCTNSAQVVVTLTINPVISIVPTPSVICSGGSSALTASGASTYTWSPTTTLSSANGSVVNANPNATSIYNVSGTSALGCKSFTTVTLTVVATPTITTTGNPLTICAGSTSTLNAFGASTFTWSPGNSVSNVNGSPTIATPAFTTTYTVNGSNGATPFLCSSSSTIQIVVNPNPTVTPSPSVPICEGQFTTIYASGGDAYSWSPTTGVTNPSDSTTIVSPMITTIYTVTATTNNCSSTATVEVLVNALPILNAGIDTTVNIDNTITLIGSGTNVEYIGFLSPDGSPLNCNYCTTIIVNPQENTCYTLEGISTFGCRNTDVVCVNVTKDWDVFIPNAFTPNGDLNNEVFIPMGYGISEIQLTIFDRWGHQIFKSTEDIIGWDGKNKGQLCEQGVYIYQAEIKAMSGAKLKKTGHVTLIPRVK